MNDWLHRTCIIPDAYVALARQLAAAAAESGVGMFTTPLSATGQEPATHWISAGLLREEFAAILDDAQAIADLSGGQVSLATAQSMLDASVVRRPHEGPIDPENPPPASDPRAVLDELGLKIVQPEGT